MVAMAAASHLGASCSKVRLSQLNVAGPAATNVPRSSFRTNLSSGLVLQHRPQRLFHCIAEAPADSAPSQEAASSQDPPPKAGVSKKKPSFSMSKGQIVRVDKEKYLNSIEYYAVNHPKFFKGIDYIYEDRGEILDLRNFEAGEYALITWAGIPTSPAWLPTYMLIKSEKLSYKRE